MLSFLRFSFTSLHIFLSMLDLLFHVRDTSTSEPNSTFRDRIIWTHADIARMRDGRRAECHSTAPVVHGLRLYEENYVLSVISISSSICGLYLLPWYRFLFTFPITRGLTITFANCKSATYLIAEYRCGRLQSTPLAKLCTDASA
jgi:hypothetical protein